MSIQSETAQERLRLADRFLERGFISEALHHIDAAQQILLRLPIDDGERTEEIRGESYRYEHLGQVIAERRKLAFERR